MSVSFVRPASLSAGSFSGSSIPGSKAGADLPHAAGEFESILLTQLLQGAENSFGSVPGSDEYADASDEQMKSFAVQALAKAFSAAGGIGLAPLVTKALSESK